MTNWWETDPNALAQEPAKIPAVAYYRHSAHALDVLRNLAYQKSENG